jgi:chemotaxis protein CheD
MSDNSPTFNPATLPAEFMKNFEHAETKGPSHFLYPGQVFVTADPICISTILGSCAAVCLWDRNKRAGGLNHYLLPEGPDDGPNRLRYGTIANPELLRQTLALGCEIRNLQAKIFGGATAFGTDPSRSLGARNVQLAEEFLRSEGIPIVEKDVSGKRGRRLVFQVSDGVTLIKNFEQV